MCARPFRTALILLALLVALGLSAQAKAARFAVLVGNDNGQGADPRLRFAESDAVRLAELLVRLGGFSRDETVVLRARTAGEFQLALAGVAERLRAIPGDHLVLVYYSGHADAQALHLGTSVFPLAELRESVDALPAATRVLILDACQAGVLTRPKGGRSGSGFEIDLGKNEVTKGLAILAASSRTEPAQESDQLGASVFTHFLEVGLSGLADRNRDGNVSLGEVFEYTADHTLAATMGTTTGPQHPTFRLDLSGRDDLILTRPGSSGAGYGRLRLDVPGWYFVRRGDGQGDGRIAAEVLSRGDDVLALEPGSYEVSRRERNKLDVATLSVGDGETSAISQASSHAVAFGRMVRKGEGPAVAYGLAMSTAVRSSLEELGASAGAVMAARAELSQASIELRGGLGRAQQASPRFASTTWDFSLAAAALRAHDAGTVMRSVSLGLTWAFGVELGVSYMKQALDDGERRASWNPFVGPVALAELTFGRRFFLRADVGVPVYALRVQTAETTRATAWRPAFAGALGAGTSF